MAGLSAECHKLKEFIKHHETGKMMAQAVD